MKSETAYNAAKETSLICILRFFCGRRFDLLDWSSSDLNASIEGMKERIYSVMKGRVESRLEIWYSDTTLESKVIGKWYSKGPFDVSKATLAQQSYLKQAVQTLQQLLCLSSSRTYLSCAALFKRGYGSKSYNSHERVEVGDVVEVLIGKHDPLAQFITVSADGAGSPLLFVVGGIISVTSGSIWLVVKPCTAGPSSAPQVPDYNGNLKIHVTTPSFYEPKSHFQFLELSNNVRKVGYVHDCESDGQCLFDAQKKSVAHSTTTLRGGHYFILSRFTAYPPRRS